MKRNRFRLFGDILAVASLYAVSSIAAYFSSEDSVTNTFQSNGFNIMLTESNWNPTNGQNLMPGDEIEKNPVVSNLEDTDAYVFLKVSMAYDKALLEDADGNILTAETEIPLYKFVVGENCKDSHDFEQVVYDGWTAVKEEKENHIVTYIYDYAQDDEMTTLKCGMSTPPLFDKIKLWNFNENAYKYSSNIIVVAIGIQAELFQNGEKKTKPSEVWGIIQNG